MRQVSPEQAHLYVQDFMLGIVKNEFRTTKSVLAAVPDENLNYRPDPYAKTANELLRHIASADNFFLKSVVDGLFVPGSVKIPENVKTPGEIVEWYETEYTKNFAAVTRLSGEQLIKMVDFRGLFERPAFTFLQAGLLHTVHTGASWLRTCVPWAVEYRQFTAKASIRLKQKKLRNLKSEDTALVDKRLSLERDKGLHQSDNFGQIPPAVASIAPPSSSTGTATPPPSGENHPPGPTTSRASRLR